MTIPPSSGLPQAESAALLSGWRYRAVIWSVLFAAGAYLGFAFWSGWHDVAYAFGQVGVFGIAIALGLSLLNYGLRFVRWQFYLAAMDHPMPAWPSLKIYLAGFALTTTPGKAGEALRGVLLKRWGVPYPTSLAAFLSERLSDLLAVVLLALFGLSIYPAAQAVIVIAGAALLAAFVVLSDAGRLKHLHARISGIRRMPALLHHLVEILLQSRRCHSPELLLGATTLSLVAWAAEAWAFHVILHWMGLEVSLPFAVFVYAISMLAGALSFMPGGLGGAEAVMVGLLMGSGLGEAHAVAATVLIRVTTLWFAVWLGMLTWLAGRHSRTG